MNIPRYWAKATSNETHPMGKPYEVTCWRSSDKSADDAYASALTAATRAVKALCGGQRLEEYWYARGPIREEVIERFTDSRGELFAAVTRNRYGALVLNAAKVMFIDWDAPRRGRMGWTAFLKKLFGRKAKVEDEAFEAVIRERLARFQATHRDWTVRLYATAGGLRGLVTHSTVEAVTPESLAVLRSLGSDPLFIRLCESQANFRARLTPKPWRCGAGKHTFAWPREENTQRFEKWLARYEQKRSGFATCRYLSTIGPGTAHADIKPIIKLHDTLSRATEELPLA